MKNNHIAGQTEASVPAKEDKHLSIERAIDELGSLETHTQSIIDKALGHPSAASDNLDYAENNLNDFLDGAGVKIRGRIQAIHEQLAQLENILF